MTNINVTDSSDEALMVAAQSGNRIAFEALYDRYSGKLFGYFYRMLRKDREIAEDYTQEVFLKIIQSKSTYDGTRAFKTWIFSIAHNMCKNNYRKEEVVKRAANELIMTTKNSIPQDSNNVDRQTFKQELDRALANLNHVKRACFIMRFKQGLSIKEIATIEEVSEGTIKSRIFYVLKELTASLKEFNPKFSHESI